MDKVSDIFRKLKKTLRSWGVFQWSAFGVSVISLILIGSSVVGFFNKQTDYETMYPQNAAKIASLNTELKSYQDAVAAIDPELMEADAKSAYANGSRVAFLQNAFWDCYTNNKLNTESLSDALGENINKLSEYFDENTGAGYDVWFMPDFDIVNVTGRLSWKFVSDVRSSADEFDVVWLCKDSQDVLVAYAKGVYDTDTELFSNVTYKTTSYGRSTFQNEIDEYMEDSDPEMDGTYIPVDNVDIPAGYKAVIDETGNVSIVDDEGNPYVEEDAGDYDVWAGGFKDDFSEEWEEAVTGRAEAIQNQQSQDDNQ